MRQTIVVIALISSLGLQAQRLPDRHAFRQEPVLPDVEMAELYFALSDLGLHDQRDQTWGLDSDTRATLWKYNIVRYLRDHPELSADSRDVLQDAIRLVSTPGWFDIDRSSVAYPSKQFSLEQLKVRAAELLPPDMIYEVFIRFGAEPAGSKKSPKSPVQTNGPFGGMCSCASDYDCGGDTQYKCFSSWCIDTTHCGFYGDELCTSKCKDTSP